MAKASSTSTKEIEILEVQNGRLSLAIVGTTPLICNRVSEKAKRELVLPKGRKTAADKAQTLKHDPLAEFRASPYMLRDDTAPTLLGALAVWFKKAAMTAALDLPGAQKSQIGRLVRAEGERVPLYGVPQLLMAVTRSADMNRTPDIRTRAIIPHWAVLLDVTFAKPALREKAILNLFAAAGLYGGAGDWRTQKGSGNYGSWRLAGSDDEELQEIMATGRRAEQIAAMNTPVCYDDETEELLTWYTAEVEARGFNPQVNGRNRIAEHV